MVVLVDTDTLAPRERNDALSAVLGSVNGFVVSHDLPDEHIRNRTHWWDLDSRFALIRVRDTNLRLSRAEKAVRADDREFSAISFQHSGTGVYLKEDGVTVQRPSALVLENLSESMGFRFDGEADNQSFVMAQKDLDLPDTVLRGAAARLQSSPLYRLLQDHLARLSDVVEELPPDGPAAALLATTTLELVRALVASTSTDDRVARDVTFDALPTTVMTYVRHHLREPALNAKQIALANHVSVRQLYKLWAGRGESLSDWILHERLDGARRDLASPKSLLVTIEVVARRWGFVNASQFSRSFRAEFGTSPREWRAA